MARFVWGIIIATFYSIFFIVMLFKNNSSGVFFLIPISIGVLLIIYGLKYIKLRKIVVIHILKMLKESGKIDIDEIVNRYNVTEDKIRIFLFYIQKRGILSTYCNKCNKELPIKSLESFILKKLDDVKPCLCPDCGISMSLNRAVYKPKILLKIGGVSILVGFIYLFIGIAVKDSYRAEVSPLFIVLGILFVLIGAIIKFYRCLNCNEKLGKNILTCPVCGSSYYK